MFYAWESSRHEFTDAIRRFVADATGDGVRVGAKRPRPAPKARRGRSERA
jgi:hypothetical protein